jgi:nitrite reductase/ring-hydroxylating ferredoxin subunit
VAAHRAEGAGVKLVFTCALRDLPDGAAKGFDWDGGGYARSGFLVRQGSAVHAYRNECPHAGNRLDWKPDAFLTKDRSLIMCSVHGANFRIHDGLCVAGPCMGRALTRLEAVVAGEQVEVRVSESA